MHAVADSWAYLASRMPSTPGFVSESTMQSMPLSPIACKRVWSKSGRGAARVHVLLIEAFLVPVLHRAFGYVRKVYQPLGDRRRTRPGNTADLDAFRHFLVVLWTYGRGPTVHGQFAQNRVDRRDSAGRAGGSRDITTGACRCQ